MSRVTSVVCHVST